MSKRYVIWHQNDKAPESPGICEVEGGICYDHYSTEAEAQASCDEYNGESKRNGWGSFYWPKLAPDDQELSAPNI